MALGLTSFSTPTWAVWQTAGVSRITTWGRKAGELLRKWGTARGGHLSARPSVAGQPVLGHHPGRSEERGRV